MEAKGKIIEITADYLISFSGGKIKYSSSSHIFFGTILSAKLHEKYNFKCDQHRYAFFPGVAAKRPLSAFYIGTPDP